MRPVGLIIKSGILGIVVALVSAFVLNPMFGSPLDTTDRIHRHATFKAVEIVYWPTSQLMTSSVEARVEMPIAIVYNSLIYASMAYSVWLVRHRRQWKWFAICCAHLMYWYIPLVIHMWSVVSR